MLWKGREREGGIQGLNVDDDDGHDHNNKERTRPRYAIQVAVETSEDRRNRNETGWPPTLPSHNAFVLCRVLEYRSYSAGAPLKIVHALSMIKDTKEHITYPISLLFFFFFTLCLFIYSYYFLNQILIMKTEISISLNICALLSSFIIYNFIEIHLRRKEIR